MTNAEQNGVLRWPGKVLSADDLARHLKGQHELVVQRQAIVTPLAVDELKKLGVRLSREDTVALVPTRRSASTHGFAEERPSPMVTAAVQSLQREGAILTAMPACNVPVCDWARMLAESVARGEFMGVVVFCVDPGLVCCPANKVAGLRAASVLTVTQAARALSSMGANLLAVEMPGRTLFEIRQIMLNLCRARTECPQDVADTLQELDGHAHR